VRKFSIRTSAVAASAARGATPSGFLEVDGDAALVAVVDEVAGGLAVLVRGPRARFVTDARVLDLDHVGAEVSEQRAAVRGRPARARRSTTRRPSRDSGVGGAVGVLMCATILNMTRLADALTRRILVLDGAMGTMIQAAGLGADDFGGERYEGCNEHLNLTRPT